MIERKLAAVRPRVFVPDGAGVSLVEDQVAEHVERREPGVVELTGPAGAGKSTALEHLAATFGDEPFVVLVEAPDQWSILELSTAANDHLVVYASPVVLLPFADVELWALAPWGQDEGIEYLLARHREMCASVMRRLAADRNTSWLGSRPELWCIVLDRFAADEQLADVKEAVRQAVYAHLPTSDERETAREASFAALQGFDRPEHELLPLWNAVDADARRLLRHDPVQMLLGAEYFAGSMTIDPPLEVLKLRLAEVFVHEVASLLRDNMVLIERLREVLAGRDGARQPTAASLLHATNVGWTPRPGRAPMLADAYLPEARWRGARLVRLDVSRANLSGADLSESKLIRLRSHGTQLSGACLHGAILKRWSAIDAVLTDADLSHVNAPEADFKAADLRDANLQGAFLRDCNFHDANLRGACFVRADLKGARFGGANIEGADFSGADLWEAYLWHVVMRLANFTGARFLKSSLIGCDLETMRLPGANFTRANLSHAHLTGSHMPCANFYHANLSNTGLAEINWEGADLRGANLSGATFHLGSSRSGLVGSPIASEGSRTGFYTDEYLEQGFKTPEEIRKANLYGADLRGAEIDGVDFYLVDLRNARYTPEQEHHLRRSGAILEVRTN